MSLNIAERIRYWNQRINDWSSFLLLVTEEPCIKEKVIFYYKQGYVGNTTPVERPQVRGLRGLVARTRGSLQNFALSNRQRVLANFSPNVDNNVRAAAHWIWRTKGRQWIYDNILVPCAGRKPAPSTEVQNTDRVFTPPQVNRPFDRRIDRLELAFNGEMNGNKKDIQQLRFVPFSSDFAELSTTGYLISQNTLAQKKEANEPAAKEAWEKVLIAYGKIAENEFYKGVPALQNYYALVRLYGSDGGKYLLNQKGERRWYEVDSTINQDKNYASTPTTSALISWGQGDPYGRTPYQFTDFVFSKYWNKIQNNRLITLRRYAAPILDNLKFPGMVPQKVPANIDGKASDVQINDEGSSTMNSIAFPPMATAITYFGENTGNSLNSILKFTTGVLWDEVQAGIWEATTEHVPSNTSGPGSIYGPIARFAEMMNVAGGNFDRELVMAGGQLPPDPYENGPYENRIRGPVNRIDKVTKRAPGLAFQWEGLNLVFEYAARPVGGINPKAVLLDIMSNFLVMGSASAVFFGGAHRFMAAPAQYPFLGGQEGIEKWYKGDPIGWGLTTVRQFTTGGANPEGSASSVASNLFKNMEQFFSQLFSGTRGNIFGAITSLFTGATGNLINNEIAKKTAGQVPYLQGLKAILTGEPVGEWHITVGNPLNPIAMIGNLVCSGITVEFNEELGPDDFPTEIKITVNLKHAMARDRDAIESVFNRGMGRIYNLPDSMSGSADYQTVVDRATRERTNTGNMPGRRLGILKRIGQDSGFISPQQVEGRDNPMGGEVSVWNRSSFRLGISENSAQQFITNQNDIFLSSYRVADWIAQRSLQ